MYGSNMYKLYIYYKLTSNLGAAVIMCELPTSELVIYVEKLSMNTFPKGVVVGRL